MENENNLVYWKGRLVSATAAHEWLPSDPGLKEEWQMCVIQVEKLERIAFNQRRAL
jgi:hypothetical protein